MEKREIKIGSSFKATLFGLSEWQRKLPSYNTNDSCQTSHINHNINCPELQTKVNCSSLYKSFCILFCSVVL